MAFNPFERYDNLVSLFEEWQRFVLPYDSATMQRGTYPNLLDCALSVCADIGIDAFIQSEAKSLLAKGITDKRLKKALLDLPSNFPGIERLNDKTGDFSALQACSRREYEWKMANGEFTFVLNKFFLPTFIHPMLQNVGQRVRK